MAAPAATTTNAGTRNITGSLYVGDLPNDITENLLYETFNKVGMVMSIKVCRDINTNRSLGYAYVNFQNPQDADRALETLNYTALNGRPMRIMWSQRDPILRKGGNGNVFIKNLDNSIDNRALFDTFSVFGNILSCKVVTDDATGASKGYGFVHFESEDAAKEAIDRVNNMLMNGKPVHVGPFIKRAQRMQEHEKTFTSVYVKGLADEVDTEKLKTYAEKEFGPIDTIFVSGHKDHPTKFGLIKFKDHESATKLIDKFHGKVVEGYTFPEKTLSACRALKKSDRLVEVKQRKAQATREQILERQGRNVYVKHFDDDVSEDKLKELFATYGPITSCVIMRDHNKNSRGFGFVCFEKKENADAAIRELNSKVVFNRPLYVSLAQVKDQRRRELEKVQQMRGAGFLGGMGGYQGGYSNFIMPPFHGYMGGMRGAAPMMNLNKGPGFMGRGGFMGMPPIAGGIAGRGRGLSFPPRGRGAAVPPQFPAAKSVPRYTQQAAARPAPPNLAAELSRMSPDEQKNFLGEKLYTSIMATNPSQAAKITGMLLEMDTPEILNILEDRYSLNSKIDEALAVLKAHEEKK